MSGVAIDTPGLQESTSDLAPLLVTEEVNFTALIPLSICFLTFRSSLALLPTPLKLASQKVIRVLGLEYTQFLPRCEHCQHIGFVSSHFTLRLLHSVQPSLEYFLFFIPRRKVSVADIKSQSFERTFVLAPFCRSKL